MTDYLPKLSREKFVEVLMQLSANFPRLFKMDEKQLKLMKVGIHADIKTKTDIKSNVLRLFLHEYCNMREYRRLHKAGAIRYDLYGMPSGEVTKQEAKDKLLQTKKILKKLRLKKAGKDKEMTADTEVNGGMGK